MTDRPDNPKARKNRVICRSAEVPEGWVVVGEHHSPACEGDGANAWVIKQPGRREVVRAGTPVPAGYRKVRDSEMRVGEAVTRGWLIEREE
jgi:uncharacterized protein YbdZ (MbtH family)